MKSGSPATFAQYITRVPPNARKALKAMRLIVKRAAPGATEVISYGMPAFRLNGMLVYFAAWKAHIGLYPAGTVKLFEKELVPFERTKGSIHFPLDKPLPVALIARIVKLRVRENLEKTSVRLRRNS